MRTAHTQTTSPLTVSVNPAEASLPLPPLAPLGEVDRAGRWLWLTFAFFVVTLTLGLAWDRFWHTTHRFETFYSPPHLFIYGTTLITAARVGWAAWSPKTRGRFAPVLRHRVFGTLSGPVGLTGVGLVLLGFAGLVLDNAWHTRFGLDETGWSTPHAMIGWTIFAIALGFMACRLALREQRPLGIAVAVLLGWCVLTFTATPVLGPFEKNFTPAYIAAQTEAITHFPAIASQPGVDHVRRITAMANLTRTNPAFALFGAAWVGLTLALVRAFDRRLRVLLLVVALWSLLQLLGDRGSAQKLAQYGLAWRAPAQWLPAPILPAALAYALFVWRRAREWVAWGAAGLTFGLCAFAVWGRGAGPLWLLAVLAAPLICIAGATVGERIRRMIERPTANDLLRLAPLIAVTAPIFLGLIDLWLRHSIP